MKRSAELPVIGMDIAKSVFQIHIMDPESGEIERAKLKRDEVLQFFANRQPALVAMEACGGAHPKGWQARASTPIVAKQRTRCGGHSELPTAEDPTG